VPSWEVHYKYATQIKGIKIDRLKAEEIDRFLDAPTVGGYRLAHHSLHNEIGIRLAQKIWGSVGEEYARAHIELDRMPKHVRPNMHPIMHNFSTRKKGPLYAPNFGLALKLFLFLIWLLGRS
jgi:hypothetical protein